MGESVTVTVRDGHVQIRPFKQCEQKSLLVLWADCDMTGPDSQPQADIDGCVSNRWSQLLVAELEASLVGSVMLGHDGNRGWVHYLAVAQHCRCRGIGQQLMQTAESWMGERSVDTLEATVRPGNLLVRGFYSRIGYRPSSLDVFVKRLTTQHSLHPGITNRGSAVC